MTTTIAAGIAPFLVDTFIGPLHFRLRTSPLHTPCDDQVNLSLVAEIRKQTHRFPRHQISRSDSRKRHPDRSVSINRRLLTRSSRRSTSADPKDLPVASGEEQNGTSIARRPRSSDAVPGCAVLP